MITFLVLMSWLADPHREVGRFTRLWVWSRLVAWAGARRLDTAARDGVA